MRYAEWLLVVALLGYCLAAMAACAWPERIGETLGKTIVTEGEKALDGKVDEIASKMTDEQKAFLRQVAEEQFVPLAEKFEQLDAKGDDRTIPEEVQHAAIAALFALFGIDKYRQRRRRKKEEESQ